MNTPSVTTSIRVRADDKPTEVNLWRATNPKARDFRLVTIGPAYTKSRLEATGENTYLARVPQPASGWTAFFVELVFDRGGPTPFKFTTQVSIVPDVLRALIRETALDPARFEADFVGAAYEAVMRDCAEGAAWFGVSGLPTVVLKEKLSLVGAVPTDRYRLLIDWILAGEPGGVIPLSPETATAGRSPVEQALR